MPEPTPLPEQPLFSSTVVPKFLTEDERRLLQELNLNPDQPLPDNLAEIVERVAPAEPSPEIESPMLGVSLPTRQLTPEQKQEILRHIAQARAEAGLAQLLRPPGENLSSSGKEHWRHLQQIVQQSLRDAPEASSSGSASPAKNGPDQPEAESPPPPQNEASSGSESPQTASSAGTSQTSAPRLCPCCGWDQSRTEVVEVRDEDKTEFMTFWLCGQPFQKTYSLIRGRIQLTFRELSEDDKIEIHRQLGRDIDQQKFPRHQALGALEAALARYQCCLQLIRFEAEKSLPFHLPRSLEEWDQARLTAGATQQTILEYANQLVFGKLIRYESMKVAIYRKLAHFNDLVARLALLQETDPDSF